MKEQAEENLITFRTRRMTGFPDLANGCFVATHQTRVIHSPLMGPLSNIGKTPDNPNDKRKHIHLLARGSYVCGLIAVDLKPVGIP